MVLVLVIILAKLGEVYTQQRRGLAAAQSKFPVTSSTALRSHVSLPSEGELIADLENSRLDLVGLRQGYQSQEQTVRAAVLAQFPKVVFGFNPHSSDTTNVPGVPALPLKSFNLPVT